MRRQKKIVVKCHPSEHRTIQAKAISLDKEAATYLRELGLTDADPTSMEDEVEVQLHWFAGQMRTCFNAWMTGFPKLPVELADTIRDLDTALRQFQMNALIDRMPIDELRSKLTQAIKDINHANKSYKGK